MRAFSLTNDGISTLLRIARSTARMSHFWEPSYGMVISLTRFTWRSSSPCPISLTAGSKSRGVNGSETGFRDGDRQSRRAASSALERYSAPSRAGDPAPGGRSPEELSPKRPRALESEVNLVRDRRGRCDPHEPPQGGHWRRAESALLRFSEIAERLDAISLRERGPADDELSCAAQRRDFRVLARLRSEQLLELVQQIPFELEPRRAGREVSLVQLRAVASVL